MKPHRPPHTASFSLQAFTFFSLQAFRLSGFFLALVCLHAFSPSATAAPKLIINADFENGMPPGVTPSKVTTAIDTTRAHSGRASLRISTEPNAPGGSFAFELDGLLDPASNAEFSLWLYAAPDSKPSASVSADDGTGRYTIGPTPLQPLKTGEWIRMTGRVHAGDWHKSDSAFKLIVSTSGTVWIDDVQMATGTPETPAQIWPRLKQSLHAAAGKRASPLAPGATLALDPRHAALAPDTATTQVILPIENLLIPAEGLLVFAIDAATDLDLAGTLHLDHTAPAPAPASASGIQAFRSSELSLSPGLRVTVLCDDTVIGAPSVKAASWNNNWAGGRPGPLPDGVLGEPPPSTVELVPFRMTKGRHYITIAGPHMRPGGTFTKLELRASGRPSEKPLYSFALFADTHVAYGRFAWTNTLLTGSTGGELEAALRQLKSENAVFAIIAGDMTNRGRRKEIESLAGAIRRGGLPVYGCFGNHDTPERTSRDDYASLLPEIFPSGPENTDYAVIHPGANPPLRFIMLDGTRWNDKDGKLHGHRATSTAWVDYRDGMIDWLRDTLAKDTTTPTILVSHFQFYRKTGVSGITGYNMDRGRPALQKNIMDVLASTPNVVATVSGHHHYNAVAMYDGITCIMNPGFAEWPNAYHVCHVHADRIVWETRQFSNRGLIREGVVKEKALLFELHTVEGDLAGTINLAPRNPSQPATP